jgi:hypothetical protein
MVAQPSGLDALSLDELQRLLAVSEAAGGWDALTPAAEAAQREAIGQQMTDQPPLLVGPVVA